MNEEHLIKVEGVPEPEISDNTGAMNL